MSFGRIGGVYAMLHAGHTIGDYWVQTNKDAQVKVKPGRDGQKAAATHVATLTATQALLLAAAATATGERLPLRRTALGLAVNAASHYWADRRTPLRNLADRLAFIGKRDFYEMGDPPLASGAHALDQAWHIGWCGITAVIIGGGRP